jgi:SAM-dependent methyltransferase
MLATGSAVRRLASPRPLLSKSQLLYRPIAFQSFMQSGNKMANDPSEGQSSALGAVYAAQSPQELAKLYDDWASGYDAEMALAGYRHPAIALALLGRHLPKTSKPILDAGCGTGLTGEWLCILGYPNVEGLDLSDGMLAVARSKNIYRKLHKAALGQPLDFHSGAFAAVLCTGVFTTGHVGVEGLPELVRLTEPGGVLVLTVKLPLWEQGLEAALVKQPVEVLEQTAPYDSMPGKPGTIGTVAVVLRKMI